MRVPLSRIAHGRSGDKGDTSNIGIIAYDSRHFGVLGQPVIGQYQGFCQGK